MIPSTLQKILGTKVAVVAAGLVLAAGAGVAGAAAADLGPWQPDVPEVSRPPATSEATTTLATTTTVEVTTTLAPEPTEPPTTAKPEPTEPPTTVKPEPPRTTAPKTTEPRTTEPKSTEPPTTEKRPETSVPQGIELACFVEAGSVHCEWHGGVEDGFARFLVLRSDGRMVFDTPGPDQHVYVDTPEHPGEYSYIVVSVNGDGRNLSHSNKVTVQIGDGI